MFSGIGFGSERIGLAALKFPKLALVVLLAFMALVGVSLPKVTFDDDIHRVFMSDSALSQAQRAYERAQVPLTSTVLIHVSSDAALTAAQMTALRTLALDLEFLEGVTSVASPFVLRWPPQVGTPSGTPLFAPQISDSFADDLAAFEALGTGLPSFLNEDLTAALLGVSVRTDQMSVPDAMTAITAELERSLPASLTAQLTGEDVISAQIVSGLKADLIALNLWGALIVTLAAVALLRDLRMALVAVVPALLGAASVLGLSVWLGFPVTVLSNVIPILLLVLGVANGVHLAGHLKDHPCAGGAVEAVGPACGLTALTTAVAFASILLSGNAQLTEFAVLGALGTLLAFVVVIVTFALMARRVRLSQRPVPRLSGQIAHRLATAGAARPRFVSGVCAAALVLSAVGFSQTKAWFPLYQNLPDDSETVSVNDAIAQDFGGVFQMIVETDGTWAQTRTLAEALEQVQGTHAVLSEVNLARWLGTPEQQPNDAQLNTVPPALARALRTDEGAARIFVSVPEPMRNDATLAQFDSLYATATSAGAQRVIGLPTVMRQEAVRLIDQLSFGLLLAALGATALCAFAFRSWRLVPVLIVPNTLPLLLTGASLHLWAAGALTPTAVLALTIAFGIAIDDTVHFLNRFAAARGQGQTAAQAVAAATNAAGRVMVMTTLLLTAGLSVTLLSDFTPIRLFGGMMIVTLWAALLIDLLLLPALLRWERISNEIF